MEAIISDLLSRFEKGALTRRGLIQGLTMVAAAGGAAQAQAPSAGLKACLWSLRLGCAACRGEHRQTLN